MVSSRGFAASARVFAASAYGVRRQPGSSGRLSGEAAASGRRIIRDLHDLPPAVHPARPSILQSLSILRPEASRYCKFCSDD